MDANHWLTGNFPADETHPHTPHWHARVLMSPSSAMHAVTTQTAVKHCHDGLKASTLDPDVRLQIWLHYMWRAIKSLVPLAWEVLHHWPKNTSTLLYCIGTLHCLHVTGFNVAAPFNVVFFFFSFLFFYTLAFMKIKNNKKKNFLKFQKPSHNLIQGF